MSETPPVVRIVPAAPGCAAELLALQKRCFREEAERSGEFDIPPLTQTLDSLLEDFRTHSNNVSSEALLIIGSHYPVELFPQSSAPRDEKKLVSQTFLGRCD